MVSPFLDQGRGVLRTPAHFSFFSRVPRSMPNASVWRVTRTSDCFSVDYVVYKASANCRIQYDRLHSME